MFFFRYDSPPGPLVHGPWRMPSLSPRMARRQLARTFKCGPLPRESTDVAG